MTNGEYLIRKLHYSFIEDDSNLPIGPIVPRDPTNAPQLHSQVQPTNALLPQNFPIQSKPILRDNAKPASFPIFIDDESMTLEKTHAYKFVCMPLGYQCDGCNNETCPNGILRMYRNGRSDWVHCTHCGKYLNGTNAIFSNSSV